MSSKSMYTRPHKGNSLLEVITDYVCLDIETTGLDPKCDSIIEVGAVRYRNGVESERFSSLINPGFPIDEFITSLTGITNEMLKTAPSLGDVMPAIAAFISDDIIIGHNVNFDYNFLYDAYLSFLKKPLCNNFIDTMRISRRIYRDLDNHRLSTLARHLKVSSDPTHRALDDALVTSRCYFYMCTHISDNGIELNRQTYLGKQPSERNVFENPLMFDFQITDDMIETLTRKVCVFTGKLEKMTRAEAHQLVKLLGGTADDNVTSHTNYLVLGNNDYCSSIRGGKSSKHRRAEQYKRGGADIEIISEDTFYTMLGITD